MALTVTIPTIHSASCSDLQSDTTVLPFRFFIAVTFDECVCVRSIYTDWQRGCTWRQLHIYNTSIECPYLQHQTLLFRTHSYTFTITTHESNSIYWRLCMHAAECPCHTMFGEMRSILARVYGLLHNTMYNLTLFLRNVLYIYILTCARRNTIYTRHNVRLAKYLQYTVTRKFTVTIRQRRDAIVQYLSLVIERIETHLWNFDSL